MPPGSNASVLTFGLQFSLNFLQTAVVYEFFRNDLDGGGAETRLSTEVTFRLSEDGQGGTDLHLVVRGVPDSDRVELIAGWVNFLMTMRGAVDFGE